VADPEYYERIEPEQMTALGCLVVGLLGAVALVLLALAYHWLTR
jgi:hypothetical protein